MKKTIKLTVMASLISGFMVLVGGCGPVRKSVTRTAQIAAGQLKASGAGIVKADEQNTIFRIKCGACGYENVEITIPTPQPGKPYTLNWVCPECGYKQTIVIKVV